MNTPTQETRSPEISDTPRSLRQITHHRGNSVNNRIIIQEESVDDKGVPFDYRLAIDHMNGNSPLNGEGMYPTITFHSGPTENVCGITNEVLLAIVQDRLEAMQKTKFSCRENAIAITKIEETLLWLKKRTFDRQAKGIEGTQTL